MHLLLTSRFKFKLFALVLTQVTKAYYKSLYGFDYKSLYFFFLWKATIKFETLPGVLFSLPSPQSLSHSTSIFVSTVYHILREIVIDRSNENRSKWLKEALERKNKVAEWRRERVFRGAREREDTRAELLSPRAFSSSLAHPSNSRFILLQRLLRRG